VINALKRAVKAIPVLGPWAVRMAAVRRRRRGEAAFPGSTHYWEERYAGGGDSGHGSYGRFAEFKAEVLNRFVAEHHIETVVEFGCGDGNQLALASYPDYVGLDVSETALGACRKRFAGDRSRRFRLYRPGRAADGTGRHSADLALSLDVIFHLTEDAVFESYMNDLFAAARRFVVIYSSDTAVTDPSEPAQVRHRNFSRWVAERKPEWRLVRRIPNRFAVGEDKGPRSFAEFFIYAPAGDGDAAGASGGPGSAASPG
jgi:SAM-dependent methyltransferase